MILNGLDNRSVTVVHGNCCLEVYVSCKELSEEPCCKNFLGVILLEDTYGGTLGNNLGLLGVNLRNGSDSYLELILTVNLVRLLVCCATGRTDAHVATSLYRTVIAACEEVRCVTAVDLLCCYPLLLEPLTEHLYEASVGLVVEEEVVTGCACVGRAVLLTHCDEPVGLRVVAKGNAIRIDLLDLLANLCHLFPCCGNLKFILLEESCVVVKNLGGLGDRKCVHLIVTECLTLCIVAGNEVSKLLCSVAVCGIVDENVKCLNSACKVVKSYVVCVAVCKVRLVTNRDLCLDLVTNTVIVTERLVNYCDVGVDLIEIRNSVVEDLLESCTHGVIECDCDGSFCVKSALGHLEIGCSSLLIAGCENSYRCEHKNGNQENRQNSFHCFVSFRFVYICFLTNKINP